jgi:hypothetical protein
LKVELTSLGIQTQIQDYKVSKKIDDFGVVVDVDTDAIFDKENGYVVLLENTMQGNTKEPALITIPCGVDEIEINGYIGHNQGKVNFKSCRMEKAVKFENPIECIINKDINIFDYTPSETNTIQGNLETEYVRKTVQVNNIAFLDPIVENSGNYVMSLNEALGNLGTLDDFSSRGFFETYKRINVYPIYGTIGTSVIIYVYHAVVATIAWQRITSPTQLSDDWIPLPPSEGSGFYLPFAPISWKSPVITPLENAVDTVNGIKRIPYLDVFYEAGNSNSLKNVLVSNTFTVNEILEDIFACTGLELRSNFFNINVDNTNPNNSEYDFAIEYLQQLKIAQSFDIIRESAIEDSFGKSGTFSAKQMILEFNKLFGLILIYDSASDVMRWEHYTYFESKGIDFELQGIEYEFGDDADINKDIINTETWTMAQPSPTDGFYSTKIDYQNYSLNSEINDINKKSDKFMTDIFGCLNNKDYEGDAYKKLFFLMATDGSNVIALNSSLSMRSIVENLHYRNRALKTGLHDNRPVTFSGYSVGLSAEISFFGSFKVFNKINPTNTVKLNVNGNGTWLIDEMEIEGKKITLKIKK